MSIALIGCGYWGKNLARNFHRLGELGVICDPSDGGREQAAKVAPGVPVEPDIGAALRSDSIRAVAIATPAVTHHDLAIRAMEAGKDVFVEKPLALTYGEGLDMREKARETGRILMVGHLLEYHPAVVKLRELIDTGELGTIRYIYSNRLNFGKVRTEENALWSFAPHDIAVILRLCGEMPHEVTCTGGSYITSGLADVTVSHLRFPSGIRAHIFVSWLNPFKEQKLVVVGDRRMAVFNDVNRNGDKLVLHDQHVTVERNSPILHKNGHPIPVPLPEDEPLLLECQHFLDSIQTRQQPLTDATSALNVLNILQECQRTLDSPGATDG